ncbi:MAG: hypothetical protein P4N60_14300 [Verrucomicrobiae bacterium]|nr:hypothetical protein [Verrucomicrobiae bacterium]
MKHTCLKIAGGALGLLLFTLSPASGQTNDLAGFAGDWTNKDFQTRDITRVQIRVIGGHVRLHAWGRCHPKECDAGEGIAIVKGQGLSAAWKQPFALRTLELTLLADGSLQLSEQTHFTDNSGRKDSSFTNTLVKGLVHDWSDPAPPK